MIGSEKRDHFAQNTFFNHFSSHHHNQDKQALDFPLGLCAHWSFYFTNLKLESTANLLFMSSKRPKRGIKRPGFFLPWVIRAVATPKQEVGEAHNFLQVLQKDGRIIVPKFKCVAMVLPEL